MFYYYVPTFRFRDLLSLQLQGNLFWVGSSTNLDKKLHNLKIGMVVESLLIGQNYVYNLTVTYPALDIIKHRKWTYGVS